MLPDPAVYRARNASVSVTPRGPSTIELVPPPLVTMLRISKSLAPEPALMFTTLVSVVVPLTKSRMNAEILLEVFSKTLVVN